MYMSVGYLPPKGPIHLEMPVALYRVINMYAEDYDDAQLKF